MICYGRPSRLALGTSLQAFLAGGSWRSLVHLNGWVALAPTPASVGGQHAGVGGMWKQRVVGLSCRNKHQPTFVLAATQTSAAAEAS